MRRLLLLVLGACACGAPLVPVMRTLALAPGGGAYLVRLTFKGLHVHHAKDLLAEDAAAQAERLSCPTALQVNVISAVEETVPGATPEAEAKSTTRIEGTIACP